ncbi:hypothetical protein [uncultured Friedmanniella sp.]|uniref:hypothetical protein n=1 Tax=uncultured Friedmanniella sp. TaxID=335381 RepID=UPI0035CB4EA2
MPQGVSVGQGDRAFNTVSSGESQGEFNRVASLLEALLNQRDQQVKAAMAHYEATDVSEEYRAKEIRWNTKAQEVRDTIKVLRLSLEQNDETALTALRHAGNAVSNI